jgi:N-acetylglucosaminyldiphosphoundecaprenol N-acetyl-beta-D-mannosaminyltransferase
LDGRLPLESFLATPDTSMISNVPTRMAARSASNQRLVVMGIRIDDITPRELIARILDADRERCLVMHANAHLLNTAWTRPWLSDCFAQADVVYCDGAGAQVACWLLTAVRPVRHTAPEWIEPLASELAERGRSIFWLGGSVDAAEAAARNLEMRTGARTAGCHHGFFDAAAGSTENEHVIQRINAAKPDLLIVNMGMPMQERWLYENWPRLNVKAALTAGALVDHVAGRVRRPPTWVANCGLEWAVRLAIEPRRLWRRYVVGLPVFGFRLFQSAILPVRSTRVSR